MVVVSWSMVVVSVQQQGKPYKNLSKPDGPDDPVLGILVFLFSSGTRPEFSALDQEILGTRLGNSTKNQTTSKKKQEKYEKQKKTKKHIICIRFS